MVVSCWLDSVMLNEVSADDDVLMNRLDVAEVCRDCSNHFHFRRMKIAFRRSCGASSRHEMRLLIAKQERIPFH